MMASTSWTSHNTSGKVIDVEGQTVRPWSELIHEIPDAVTSTVQASSMLYSLGTWMLGYLRYTCGVIGYLAACLPLHVIQPQEANEETNNGLKEEPRILTVEKSTSADSEHVLEAKHKVFLSHSGAQKDFVEQLCVDLQRCDRYPFFDKLRSSLPIGEKFPELIFGAIKQCEVGVVVLSEEFFPRSKWPMLELNAMVEAFEKPNSSIKIIPVFYRISLKEWKDAKNRSRWVSRWEEWANEDSRVNVEEWEKALRTLACINSLVMKEGMGEVKFREEMVAEICGFVPGETRWDDSHVEGRHRSCEVIRAKMNEVSRSSSGVGVVRLYGVDGIGKTTLCRALCNALCSEYRDNVCHVELGETSEMKLLQKALKRLTTISHDILDKLDGIEEGYSYLKKRMRSERIFLALDNVQDDYKTLEVARRYLRGGYAVGSVVLVTARSLDVLVKLNLRESECMEMPELGEDEARSLLMNSMGLSSGNEADERVMKDFLQLCHLKKADGKSRHYHPLALKVLGQQLGGNRGQWEVQIRRITAVNQFEDAEDAIFSIFRNSFDSLKAKHQDVFMDLALTSVTGSFRILLSTLDWLCMVYEESVEDMRAMLVVLKRKSLVEDLSNDFTKIGMHDLWIEFAVARAKAEDLEDRRWVYEAGGKKAFGRAGLRRESVKRMCFLNEGWKGLNGVRLDDFVNLEAFKLDVKFPTADCVLDVHLSGLKHLKSLTMHSRGLTVRADGLCSLPSLGFLDWDTGGFSPCLEGIWRLTKLQFLRLEGCRSVEVLDLSELKLLQVVEIGSFSDLITVRGLDSSLSNLLYLDISYCNSLRECLGLGELYALERFSLRCCGKLEEFPWLGRLTNLREFDIDSCHSIKAVPGLSEMVSLEKFTARYCSELATLPNLEQLTKLRELRVGGSPVEDIPGLDGLIALTTLEAPFDKLLGEPPALAKLSVLKVLYIRAGKGPIWTSIRNLLMLEELNLWSCRGEDVVPELQNLKRLKSVDLGYCDIKDLSGLGNLTALESLEVKFCDMLETFPNFERVTKLSYLCILDCKRVRKWPNTSDLGLLKRLTLDGSSVRNFVPIFESLMGLRDLTLYGEGCETLLRVTSVSQLESVNLDFFHFLGALDVSNFPRLKELAVRYCRSLETLTCSIPLNVLTILRVWGCMRLIEMPDLGTFPGLEMLEVGYCNAVTRLTCSSRLTALREIKLFGCGRGIEMPELSRFPKLAEFLVW